MIGLFAVLTCVFAFLFVGALMLTYLRKYLPGLLPFVTNDQLAGVSAASGLASGACLVLTILAPQLP